ncbi:MAG: GAF domain-containing protein [Actinomycetota bacterium]
MSQDLAERRRQLERVHAEFETSPIAARAAHLLASDVAASWDRCRNIPIAGRPPTAGADNAQQAWRTSPIGRAASPVLERLETLAAAEDYVAAVVDASGTIVWTSAGPSMRRFADHAHFVTGTNWSESIAGTNAPGLALATRRSAAVFAGEHWCEPVHEWVCYAAPLRTPNGQLVGALDLSSRWDRASTLAATTVEAMAQLIEVQLRDIDLGARRLTMRVLGPPRVELDGEAVHCTPRQLELLTVLSLRSTVRLDELHDALYGDRAVSTATVKAEISHLRRTLGGAIASRPYRLDLDLDVDVAQLLEALERGDLEWATTLYCGELLPTSESPFIVETRRHIEVALRNQLLASGTASQLLRYAGVHPFDLDVLMAAGTRADAGTPAAAEAAAMVERVRAS